MNYYLAIDQGTHASRVILYDAQGKQVTSKTQSIKLSRLENGNIEQDPLEILHSITTVIDKLLKSLPKDISNQIISCGIACQRSTIVACTHQGEPLSPAISWQDVRGQPYLDSLALDAEQIQNISGLPLSAHYAASKLCWLLDHHPQVQSTPTKDLYLAPLVSFLLLHLIKHKPYVVDHSQAQRMQLFNIKTLDWSEALLNAFGIPRHTLPIIKPMCSNYGLLTQTQIPVTAVCGDQNAAVFGSGELNNDKALVNLGSGAFVLRLLPELQRCHSLISGIAYTSHHKTRYLQEGTVNGSGNALSWFQQQFDLHSEKAIIDWKEQLPIWLKEIREPSLSLPVFINTVGGLGSPWWSSRIKPHFIYSEENINKKQTEQNTKSQINKNLNDKNIAIHSVAVIESIIFLIQDNLNVMEKKKPISLLKLSGGLSQIDGLSQKLANLSHIPVRRLVDKEATARGIAWLSSGIKTPWNTTSDITFKAENDPGLQERYRLFQSQMSKLLNPHNKETPYWIAHRGDMTNHPENTLLALSYALKQGTDAIEFDLQMNANHDFIVIHDDNFLRTAGIRHSVLTSITQDLKSISVHQPSRYGKRFFPQTVPLLEDVLKLLSQYPNAKAFIEIKTESIYHWGVDMTMSKLLKKLQPYTGQYVIISFSFEAIKYVKKHGDYSKVTLGWVLKKYDNAHQKQALELKPDFLICNHRKIPANKAIWKGSWQWMLYDIKDINKALELTKQGIKYIETGDIGGIMLAIKSLKKHS